MLPDELDAKGPHDLNLVAHKAPDTLQHQRLESKLDCGHLFCLLYWIMQGQHIAISIKREAVLCLDMLDASRARAVSHVALATLQVTESALLASPSSWALACSAHRIRRAEFAWQCAFVAAKRAPVPHTLTFATILQRYTVDADQAADVAITPLPPRLAWTNARITGLRWATTMAALLCQHAGVTF